MVNILIVDDENYVIEDIKASVDWKKLGISNVFAAFNYSQAKEVFEQNEIAVVLSDIEMPGGNGLELLSWIREKYPKTKTIFISCHADFNYAKEAIHLGSFEYILKPVHYDELESIIKNAIDKIKKENASEEYSRYGNFWLKHQPLLIERFWLDIINHKIPSKAERIIKEADNRNIPFTFEMKILPLLISVQRWHEEHNLEDEKIMEFGLKNIAEEMFLTEGNSGIFFQIRRGGILGILSSDKNLNHTGSALKEKCERYISECNKQMHCDLSCYLGENVYANELPLVVETLLNMEKNNVAFYNRSFLLGKQATNDFYIDAVDMSNWLKMLDEGAKDTVVTEAESYLVNHSRNSGLNFQILYQFQQDFSQMIYTHLEGKGIKAHQLLSDDVSIDLHMKAAQSVKQMVEWIRHVVAKDIEYSTEIMKSQSVVNKVLKYLQNNLDGKLTREEIANQVYLNPDYLDRIFKIETGVSVTRYINQERISAAKKLLANTDIPISDIAKSVGYSKMSNFSAFFKKACGLNPTDYRRRSLKK